MRVLFICNQNKHRSKKAEELFKDEFETRSAGLYSGNPITEEQLEWADLVVVMEEEQRKELGKRFPKTYLKKRIISLDIPDVFSFDQPELREILKSKMKVLISA